MLSAPLHSKEQERLATLRHYEILDTESEQAFEELTTLASRVCGTPISLVSLIDAERQWFKSRVGLDAEQTDRSIAFCSHAILDSQIFEVPNALNDDRFKDNPLVTGAPNIRFYAGAPLIAPNGLSIGTLCVIDDQPKQLNEDQQEALRILAKQVIGQMELRLHARKLERMNAEREQLFALLAHDLRSPFNSILGLSQKLAANTGQLSAERVTKAAQTILNSSLRAFGLVDELLHWSQLNINDDVLACEHCLLAPIVESCTELFSEVLALKKLSLDSQVSPTMAVFANSAMTKAILRNLLSNAIKFSAENEVITLTAIPAGDQIHITLANHGSEIDPLTAKQLFRSSVPSQHGALGEKGSGIGLMLCNQFVERHGGTMWLDQSIPNTITIGFSLPKAASEI